jgi:hypothetical protein
MAERMHNLEKSKRMMEMVAMNGLRPGVAWFYCITFNLWVLQRSRDNNEPV